MLQWLVRVCPLGHLTYVRVNYKWNYVCILLDLFNREIIGFSAGSRKTADLVFNAFATFDVSLDQIQMFHTDRGSEFKNYLIDDVLDTFKIKRSLSLKGCPYESLPQRSEGITQSLKQLSKFLKQNSYMGKTSRILMR